MDFIMLVGMPGSGKSTLAQQFVHKGYSLLSPDGIRNELDIHGEDKTQDILQITEDRLLECLRKHQNIIFDSTNLTISRRRRFLSLVKDFDYHKVCYVLNTPLSVCKERNALRTGFDFVPDEGYDRMEQIYQRPIYKEGWDEIITL